MAIPLNELQYTVVKRKCICVCMCFISILTTLHCYVGRLTDSGFMWSRNSPTIRTLPVPGPALVPLDFLKFSHSRELVIV